MKISEKMKKVKENRLKDVELFKNRKLPHEGLPLFKQFEQRFEDQKKKEIEDQWKTMEEERKN